jgi:hypothetical protein
MSLPRDPEARLAVWLEEGPTSGPDEGLSSAQARARSTRQRPDWLVTLRGGTMETTWRARPVLTARVAFILLISLLVLALTAGTVIVGGQLIRVMGPNDGLPTLPAVALPPTACPAGTVLKSGDIATIAGTGGPGASGNGGAATAATISPSYGMLAAGPDGALYLADVGNIRRIGADGIITTVANIATGAPFINPSGLAFGPAGELYLADLTASHIYRRGGDGTISIVAGTGTSGSSGNDGPAVDAAVQPAGIAAGPAGDLYFDDSNSYRTIDPKGIIRAFAGTGMAGFSGDGGQAVNARFATNVLGVAVDHLGNVYLGDPDNHRIRRVDPNGVITTIAGTGEGGYSGDGGPAVDALIDHPVTIAVDEIGRVYFADVATASVRMIDTVGIVHTLAGGNGPGSTGDCGPATQAKLGWPYGLAVRDGAVFISDELEHQIRMVVP